MILLVMIFKYKQECILQSYLLGYLSQLRATNTRRKDDMLKLIYVWIKRPVILLVVFILLTVSDFKNNHFTGTKIKQMVSCLSIVHSWFVLNSRLPKVRKIIKAQILIFVIIQRYHQNYCFLKSSIIKVVFKSQDY